MQDKSGALIPGGTYHLYNRANGDEDLFLSEENYRFFMQKWKLYILPVAEIYSYCLMPIHFHFLIKIRSEKEISKFFSEEKCKQIGYESLISKQFSSFFSSYTQAFNKVHLRKGSLFMKNFKRKRVRDDLYFKNLVYYIHHNPVVANLCEDLMDYKHSSYRAIVEDLPCFILREELISSFSDLRNFIHFHQQKGSNQGGFIMAELE